MSIFSDAGSIKSQSISRPFDIQQASRAKGAVRHASNVLGQSREYGPGVVQPLSDRQQQARGLLDQFTGTNPLFGASSDAINQILGGGFLPGGDQFNAARQSILEGVQPIATQGFRGGSSLGEANLADVATRALTQGLFAPAMQQFGNVALNAPGVGQLPLENQIRRLGLLDVFGGADRDVGTQFAQEERDRFLFNRDDPLNRAMQAAQLNVGALPAFGTVSDTRNTASGSTLGGVIGTGLALAGLGQGLFGGQGLFPNAFGGAGNSALQSTANRFPGMGIMNPANAFSLGMNPSSALSFSQLQ